MLRLIDALLDVLEETRLGAGKNFSHVSANLESGEGETVIRRLENRTASPKIDKLDDRVNAYSAATGVSAAVLWATALERAIALEGGVIDLDISTEQAEADATMREIEAADSADRADQTGSTAPASKRTRRKAG